MGGVNLVDRLTRFLQCLLMAENPVGIAIVTRLSRRVNQVVVPASISGQVVQFSCRRLGFGELGPLRERLRICNGRLYYRSTEGFPIPTTGCDDSLQAQKCQ